MTTAPILPFSPDAFISDTMHLTAEETGAYIMLLLCQWRNNGEPLSDDPRRLARMCRTSPKRFPKIWAEISFFFKQGDGIIWQQRLLSDYQNVLQKILTNRHNGSLGGKAKSLKNKRRALANDTNSLPPNCSKRGSISDTDIDIDIKDISKDIPKKPIKKGMTIDTYIKSSRQLPEDFRAYANKHGHPNPEAEWELFINLWQGRGETRASWIATWRNRVFGSKKAGWYTEGNKSRYTNGLGSEPPSIHDITATIISERDNELT